MSSVNNLKMAYQKIAASIFNAKTKEAIEEITQNRAALLVAQIMTPNFHGKENSREYLFCHNQGNQRFDFLGLWDTEDYTFCEEHCNIYGKLNRGKCMSECLIAREKGEEPSKCHPPTMIPSITNNFISWLDAIADALEGVLGI